MFSTRRRCRERVAELPVNKMAPEIMLFMGYELPVLGVLVHVAACEHVLHFMLNSTNAPSLLVTDTNEGSPQFRHE